MSKTHAKIRDDKKIFDTWICGKGDYLQHVFTDVNLQKLQNKDSNKAKQALLSRYQRLKKDLKDFDFYFDKFLDGQIFRDNLQAVLAEINKLYPLLQNDIQGFLKYLMNHKFATLSIDRSERADEDSDDSMNKYLALMRLFFAHQKRSEERACLFSLANNFFEYCFYPKTFSSFKKLLITKRNHPLARLLYSIMWNHLAGEGWKEWHESCLKNLKQAANENKTIVYIAGGCDIYQLIKHGIYNIRIIDPMLPTQPAYYAQHWDWFVKEGSLSNLNKEGDRLQFTFGNSSIYMERTAYNKKGYFTFTKKNKKECKIPRSVTKWSVYKDNSLVGTVVFDRRYCKQKDFLPNNNQQLLISFNELYYITGVNEPGHWKIYPNKFKKEIQLLVKQLRNPLNKSVLCNMVKADKLPFEFIRLGTCATD